jgi:hypothetical protein
MYIAHVGSQYTRGYPTGVTDTWARVFILELIWEKEYEARAEPKRKTDSLALSFWLYYHKNSF